MTTQQLKSALLEVVANHKESILEDMMEHIGQDESLREKHKLNTEDENEEAYSDDCEKLMEQVINLISQITIP